jgi:hypothetical protein
VFRFFDIKVKDVERIAIRANDYLVWSTELAKMLERYQGNGRPPRRYAFVNFTEPNIGAGVGALRCAAMHTFEVEITVAKTCRFDWWMVW